MNDGMNLIKTSCYRSYQNTSRLFQAFPGSLGYHYTSRACYLLPAKIIFVLGCADRLSVLGLCGSATPVRLWSSGQVSVVGSRLSVSVLVLPATGGQCPVVVVDLVCVGGFGGFFFFFFSPVFKLKENYLVNVLNTLF